MIALPQAAASSRPDGAGKQNTSLKSNLLSDRSPGHQHQPAIVDAHGLMDTKCTAQLGLRDAL